MLTDPALSADRIAFVWGNDVWTCRLDGSAVQRISSGPGAKMRPAFSPDGALLAFSAELDGNLDVYVVPSAGGVPKRLTWHPGRDVVQGFTPDGKAILFTSPRAMTNTRQTHLFTVPVDGRPRDAAPDPRGRPRRVLPGREDDRLQPERPAAPAVEALSRRHDVDGVALRRRDARDRARPAARVRCNDADPVG